MADNSGRTPAIRVEAVARTGEGPLDCLVYSIYAGGTEIARVVGDGDDVEMHFPGDLDRRVFLPGDLVDLVRVAVPAPAQGLSDEEVAERAHAIASLTVGPDVLDIVEFELRSGLGAADYGQAVLSDTAHDHRLDVELDGARASISHLSRRVPEISDEPKSRAVKPYTGHSPLRPFYWRTRALLKRRGTNRLGYRGADDCKGSSERKSHRRYRFQSFRIDRRCLGLNRPVTNPGKVPNAGIYFIKQQTGLPWHEQTMEFVIQHHSRRLVARIDCTTLAARVTEASQRIAAQMKPLGGSEIH